MNHTLYLNKIGEIESVFNSRYEDGQINYIWTKIEKWRESTFLQTVSQLCDSFKPSYNSPLPLPVHFNEIREQLNIQEEQAWKNLPAHEPIDDQAYQEYLKQVSALLKKWTGREDFKLTTSHVEGKFCCEVCHRVGCSGKSESEMRHGCNGFISEEMHNKITAKYGQTPDERINKIEPEKKVEEEEVTTNDA